MKTVFVIAKDGTRLMPTNIRHARRLMKRKEAVIYRHEPFTIRLTRESEHNVQNIEFKMDTGDRHIGISVCSEKHEFVSAQYDLLKDETERHNDQRKYRRTRRNRRRYRKPRFNNRKKPEGWIAPTVRHKKDAHIRIFDMFSTVCPITNAVFEVGSFDTHALQEYEQNGVVLTGTDYQRGQRYGYETQKEALLYAQGYKCPVCGKSLLGCKAVIHHRGYRIGDRSNRLNNLAAIHAYEHTSKNHQPGGKLYNLKPEHHSYASAAFMNTVRWHILNEIRDKHPEIAVSHTYGAETKLRRQDLKIRKSHANDAYAMGKFHPKHRTATKHWQKKRRNNRILSKFYDARYLDIRDGSIKKGSAIGCNRTNRSIPRNNSNNERIFRGVKKSKGRVSVRRRRYSIQPGDTVLFNSEKHIVSGVQNNGAYVKLKNGVVTKVQNILLLKHEGGWQFIPAL